MRRGVITMMIIMLSFLAENYPKNMKRGSKMLQNVISLSMFSYPGFGEIVRISSMNAADDDDIDKTCVGHLK